MTVAIAAGSDLEPSQLKAWRKLYDLMPSGGCPGTCTSRDDPCSCSNTGYVGCSADGKYLTYLDLGECSMRGKSHSFLILPAWIVIPIFPTVLLFSL